MLLTPHWVFDDYTAVTPDFLRAHGVTLLLTDLDYTLAPKSVREPDDAVRAWLAALAAAGVTVAVLSNNRSPRRVQRFCAGLGIDFVGHAQKPSRKGYRRALEKFKTPQEHTAMLGDKLLTDILGAKRSGVLALMVEPKGGARGRRLTLHVGRLRTPFTLNRPKSISRAADRKPTTGRCSARCALWPKKAIL